MATRDISPLELVLIDQPAVVGPATKTKPICLECLKGPLSLSTSIKCEGCHFPLCQNCHVQLSNNSRKLHTDRECNILAKCRQSKVCVLAVRGVSNRHTRIPALRRASSYLQIRCGNSQNGLFRP